MDKYLNVIALNIPYPANYGGVIDIYYKLVALHLNGVRIVLHCFEYERRGMSESLLLQTTHRAAAQPLFVALQCV